MTNMATLPYLAYVAMTFVMRVQYTLVSAFYDLGRDKWAEMPRGIDKYFANAQRTLRFPNPMVIYTSPDLIDKVTLALSGSGETAVMSKHRCLRVSCLGTRACVTC